MYLCVPLCCGYIKSPIVTQLVSYQRSLKSHMRGGFLRTVCWAKQFEGSNLLLIAFPLVNILNVLF